MQAPLKVSLVMPSLDAARCIEQALASIARQDDPDLELIVADGGSTDATLEILARYPQYRVLAGPDGGSHDAINKAIKATSGDIVACLNSDDVLAVGAIRRIRETFARHPEAMAVHSSAAFLLDEGTDAPCCRYLWHAPRQDQLLDSVALGVTCFNAWYFRRRLFDTIGFLDDSLDFSADRELLLRVVLGAPVVAIDEPLYGYRIHSGSRTMSGNVENIRAYVAEHLAFAERLKQRCSGVEAARILDALTAFEHGRLALYTTRSGRWPEAMLQLTRQIGSEPAWPIAFVAAVRERRRIFRELNVSWPPLAVDAVFPDFRLTHATGAADPRDPGTATPAPSAPDGTVTDHAPDAPRRDRP